MFCWLKVHVSNLFSSENSLNTNYSIPAPPSFDSLNSRILREQARISSGECLLFGRLHIGQISSEPSDFGGSVIIKYLR